jgi:hypothetical protein
VFLDCFFRGFGDADGWWDPPGRYYVRYAFLQPFEPYAIFAL